MEKERLRRADFITSIILILFGLWLLYETFQMPMKDTYGGVENVWYVSPALMPLIISIGIILLGIVLFIQSLKTGGAQKFINGLKEKRKGISESLIRFFIILLLLITYVYLFIPKVDFFLASMLFLFVFISGFYFDNMKFLKKYSLFYLLGSSAFLIIFLTKLDAILNRVFRFGIDVLFLIFFLAYYTFVSATVHLDRKLKKKLRLSLIVAILTPLILCPIFKYGFLIPLPKEGGIIALMNLIRYSLR